MKIVSIEYCPADENMAVCAQNIPVSVGFIRLGRVFCCFFFLVGGCCLFR